MHTYPHFTALQSINSILPRQNSFQESLELFVNEFDPRFNRFSSTGSDWCDDDYTEIYWRDGDPLTKDFPAEFWEWE
jgi:hypothetical protein